jgi:acetaldehyde dehydrogenase (acetylating)
MQFDQDLLSIQEVRAKVTSAYEAWQKYRNFSQEQVDAIVESMAAAAREHAQRLGELAASETGYGNAKDKYAKNMLAADILPRAIRGMKTVGVIRELKDEQVTEIATPMGVVAAILPTTNPTSTAIYKTIIALKAGNAIVVSPHPRAKQCTCETVAVLTDAALRAGAPEGLIGCVYHATIESTNELMRHKRTGVILSTGGSGIVRAAYSSGKPAFGVGPGNVPVLLDASASVAECVAGVVAGKTFDYGTICSSEQTIVAEKTRRDEVLSELRKRNAHLCDAAQAKALAKVLLTPQFTVTADCVGQPATKIAAKAGFEVPASTTVLAVEIEGVGKEHPLSAEKLSPVLSLLFVDDFAAQLKACEAILRFGGLGHTTAIYAKDDARVREYAMRMPAYRVLVNTPTPQGATGITTNVFPAMTLGCGAVAGNITSDNISPLHLINIKRLAYKVRDADNAFSAAAPGKDIVIDRQKVASAVDRFLAGKGMAKGTPAAQAAGSAIEQLVDRALAGRKPVTAETVDRTASVIEALPEAPPVAAAPPPPPPPQPQPAIVDFVCEDDVRRAILKDQKIFIGPKTIVTPSARDLATQHDTLVLAKR